MIVVLVLPVTPVTTPVAKPTVASLVLALLHVPPSNMSLNVMVEPAQTLFVPFIAGGAILMVIN